MFEVKGAGLTYDQPFLLFSGNRQRKVLRDVSFQVHAGERIGLLGVNGAGKTTLLKLMLGILQPTQGQVSFEGYDSRDFPTHVKQKFAVIFAQKSQLWWNVPVEDSLRIIGLMYGADDEVLTQRIGRLNEDLELEGLLEKAPRFLSFGQRIRCEIAAALISEPRFLFLDEPFIGLDPNYKKKLQIHLRRVSEERGVALFFASHDLEYLEGLVDRVLVLDSTQLVLDTPIERLSASATRSICVRIRFAREANPQEVLRLNTLASIFPGTSWEFDPREPGSVKLQVPTCDPEQVDFIHSFVRDNVRATSIEFPQNLTIRDILEEVKERNPDHRKAVFSEVLDAIAQATTPVLKMLHLSRLRPRLERGEECAVAFDACLRAFLSEPNEHVRAFIVSLIPTFHSLLAPADRNRELDLLLRAMEDPDDRVRATAIEAAGNSVLIDSSPGPGAEPESDLVERVAAHVRASLTSENVRIRANAHVAGIKLTRDLPQIELLERLVADPVLHGSFLHVFEVLTQRSPFAPVDPSPELSGRFESLVRTVLSLWMERKVRLGTLTVNRLLVALRGESRR